MARLVVVIANESNETLFVRHHTSLPSGLSSVSFILRNEAESVTHEGISNPAIPPISPSFESSSGHPLFCALIVEKTEPMINTISPWNVYLRNFFGKTALTISVMNIDPKTANMTYRTNSKTAINCDSTITSLTLSHRISVLHDALSAFLPARKIEDANAFLF